MLERSLMRSRLQDFLVAVSLGLAGTVSTFAHPGSSIVVDAEGHVYFVDTGQGVWKLDASGKLALFHGQPYHWMAIDEKGRFAESQVLGNLDGGSFQRITPAGAVPALVISSDYPIAVGRDGGLYYVPYNQTGRRELVRRMPDGQRSVFATLPMHTSPKPMLWVNGIASGPDGSLYVTDNDAVRKIGRDGAVSTIRDKIHLNDCADALPDTPELPYFRGVAVAADGTIYAAATGCRTVVSIPSKGTVKTVVRAERPWSPTGVALFGSAIYVLEYLHTPGDDRTEWVPRVRRITRDNKIDTVVAIQRRKN
jgi:hypothetical protein